MNDHLYFPAEWEQQSMVQLTWPHAGTDWAEYLDEITETFLQLAELITRYEQLLVVCPDIQATKQQLSERLSEDALSRVTFCECPTNDTWARDHGALTLLDRTTGDIRLLDFRFNGWGRKFEARLDNAINTHLHQCGILQAPMACHDDFVLEGGSVESDGSGTVFTTSQCLLAPNRNQPLTQYGIEVQLQRRLHAQRIVWLDHGNLIGDDTDGHIDTIVRCAPDNTLLYVACPDKEDEQYEDFQALETQLRSLCTTDSLPYRLLPLPMPDAIYEDGERLPATYANFLIINGAVIVPTYAQPEKDDLAAAIIAQAFPDRDILRIDARTIIRQHGSVHCLSMQYFK